MIAALIGSRWVVYAGALLIGAIACQGWKYHQRGVGAAQVVEKIAKKADANAQQAETVREAVAAGKPGRDDPNRVR